MFSLIPGKFSLSVGPAPGVPVLLEGPNVRQPQRHRALHDVPICTGWLCLPTVVALPIEAGVIALKRKITRYQINPRNPTEIQECVVAAEVSPLQDFTALVFVVPVSERERLKRDYTDIHSFRAIKE